MAVNERSQRTDTPQRCVSVIAGASRGIGLEIARCLRDDGHVVVAGCRTPAAVAELTGELEATGGYGVQMDVSDPASVEQAAAIVQARQGAIDSLIVCAGIASSPLAAKSESKGPLEVLTLAAMTDVLRTNALGAVWVAQKFVPLLRISDDPGVVTFITSVRGSVALTDGASSISYSMSKAALNMFVKKLSLSPTRPANSVVFAVHPGWVRTDLGGSEAPIPPDVAARDIVGLVSTADRTLNGRFVTTAGEDLPW